MKKRWVALLLLSGCIAWPTTSENLQKEDGGVFEDGGVTSGDGMATSSCPGGVVVHTAQELQRQIDALGGRPLDSNLPVVCLDPAGSPYSLSAPTASAATLGAVYFASIAAPVELRGLDSDPAKTVIVGAGAPGAQPTAASPRCPPGAARFFYVAQTGHLKLMKLTLAGGCIEGGRGGDGANGGGGGGGGAGFGGAIAVDGGRLTLDDVVFKDNVAIGGVSGKSQPLVGASGGGGGGGGLEPVGAPPDGASADMQQLTGGAGGGNGGGAGGQAESQDGAIGKGSGGGGHGAAAKTDGRKGGAGAEGALRGGGGGGGGSGMVAMNQSVFGGNGGPFGFCGGGGGGGVAKVGTMYVTTAGGGTAGYKASFGVTQTPYLCGDNGKAPSGMRGGDGGAGWGVGGAIFFAGGELTVIQLNPAAQTGNRALIADEGQLKSGPGAFLFAIGTEAVIPTFRWNGTVATTNASDVVRVRCSGGSCTIL